MTGRLRRGTDLIATGLLAFAIAGAVAASSTNDAAGMSPVLQSAQQQVGDAPGFRPGPEDVVQPDGLPALGKWMIDPDGTIAHWLDATYDDKHIREPINVILIDAGAHSEAQAKARLEEAVAAAGYPSRRGHSGGYGGWIEGEVYTQLPTEPDHAFSNLPYVLDNNHGRIFGPAVVDGGYLFIGAFSRERIAPFDELKHQYRSFDRARDDFTQRMAASTAYAIVDFVDMDNAIVGDPDVTTGDHDGRAVTLRLD